MHGPITLGEASTIVDAALTHGRATECAPLTVAVLDPGGHLVALKREDRSGIFRVEVATAKAYGALGMRLPSRTLRALGEQLPHFVPALSALSDGRFVPLPGGVLIRTEEGEVVGAVGVTGDTSDPDEACAVAGVEAAGLIPDTTSTEAW